MARRPSPQAQSDLRRCITVAQYGIASIQTCVAAGAPAVAGTDRRRLCLVVPLQFCRRQSLSGATHHSCFPDFRGVFGATTAFAGAASTLSLFTRHGEGIGENPEPRY